jgi:hypothetical protein
MAKIGTAHVEIKPVLNEEALEAIVARIESAIEAGVTRALEKARPIFGEVHVAAADHAEMLRKMQTEARQEALGGINPNERRGPD